MFLTKRLYWSDYVSDDKVKFIILFYNTFVQKY